MSTTLNQLVRDQILAEGPQIELPEGSTQADYYDELTSYVDGQLNAIANVELLERISDALDAYNRDLSVRLGI